MHLERRHCFHHFVAVLTFICTLPELMEEGNDNQDGRLSARGEQFGLLDEFVKVTNRIAAFWRRRVSQPFFAKAHLQGLLAGGCAPWQKT